MIRQHKHFMNGSGLPSAAQSFGFSSARCGPCCSHLGAEHDTQEETLSAADAPVAVRANWSLNTMASVVICPYSNAWPELFRTTQAELIRVFSPTVITVEHIGSTSVAGLAAKPVIDVLLGAASLAEIEAKTEHLKIVGYEYVSKYENEIPMRRYFTKSSVTSLRIHLHAVELGSRIWQEHLAFRDALRTDSILRTQYQSLKLALAQQFVDNKSAYSAAKGAFVQSVLAAVLERQHDVN
jgi:GrpB-like predicted nucleotidyltransferase (UPF0157 family)